MRVVPPGMESKPSSLSRPHVGDRSGATSDRSGDAAERRDPGNWARMERLAASHSDARPHAALVAELDVRAILPTIRVRPWSSSTPTPFWCPRSGQGCR